MGGCNTRKKRTWRASSSTSTRSWGVTRDPDRARHGRSWTSPTVSRCSTWARRSPGRADDVRANPRVIKAYLGETKTIGAGGSRAEATTLARLLQRNARDLRDRPAIREKTAASGRPGRGPVPRPGREFALGLAALGFKRGERLSVIGTTARLRLPRSAWAGCRWPVYQTRRQGARLRLESCRVRGDRRRGSEQVDKVLGLATSSRRCASSSTTTRAPAALQADWSALTRTSRSSGVVRGPGTPRTSRPRSRRGSRGRRHHLLHLGTTGNPKGVMLTHANAIGIAEAFRKADDIRPGGRALAICRWRGRATPPIRCSSASWWGSAQLPGARNGPARPARAGADARAGAAAHLGEQLTAVQVKLPTRRPQAMVFERFRPSPSAPRSCAPTVANPRSPAAGAHARQRPRYTPIRDQLGLRRARWALTGGAPLARTRFDSSGHRRQPQSRCMLHGATAWCRCSRAPEPIRRPPGARARASKSRSPIAARCWYGFVIFKGLPQERGGRRARSSIRRLVPHRRRGLHGPARPPRHHRPRQGRRPLRDGTPFAPQFIENKLKFSPYVARRGLRPRARLRPSMSPSTSTRWGTGRSGAEFRTRAIWT